MTVHTEDTSSYFRRISVFANYEKSSANTYALNKLPSAHEWGVNRPFNDKSSFLCPPGKNEPFLLWIVGRVSHTWFFDKQSNPAAQIALNFMPVNDHAGQTARQLLCALSKPTVCMHLEFLDIHELTRPQPALWTDGET
jgi:hypothetical protein